MKKIGMITFFGYLCSLLLEMLIFLIFPEADSLFNGNLIMNLILFFVLPVFLFLPFYAFIMWIFLGNFYGRKKEPLKIDFLKEKDYYREIITKYSSLELSYIDDYKIDYKKDLVATLLSLQLKKKINIQGDDIKIIDDSSFSLRKIEEYILSNIKFGKLLINGQTLKQKLIEDAIKDNLIRKEQFKDYSKKVFSLGIFIVIMYYLYKYREMIPVNNILFDLIYCFVDYLGKPILIGCTGFLIGFIISKKNSYIRTEKGYEIHTKLEGLKYFLKDFGNMSHKEKEELPLWEDYLTYSVLFGMNKNIVADMEKYIEINK